MNSTIRCLAILVALTLWGCDQTAPSDLAAAHTETSIVDGENEGYGFSLSGSVFVNDSDDTSPQESLQREDDELGLAQVRVDIFAANEGPAVSENGGGPYASVLTDSVGRYEVNLPQGVWIVRVTPSPSPQVEAFNPVLFRAYTSVIDPAERTVELPQEEYPQEEYEGEYESNGVMGVDFGFDPNLELILSELDGGALQTNARPTRVWRRWLRDAAGERNCPDQPNWICRDELGGYLDAIFATGQPGDVFFGNADPYLLPLGADKFEHGAAILRQERRTDVEELRTEVFTMELNYHAGLGTPDRLYDLAIVYYLEERIKDLESDGGVEGRRADGSPVISSAVGPEASLDLQIARAYNKGGGGGGEVGN